MGDKAGVGRLIAALNGPLELMLKAREDGMRNNPSGVRRYGEARPRALPGTALAVREAMLALPSASVAEPSVRLKLTGEEPEVMAVLVAARDLLHLAYPPRDFPRDGGFGVDVYLHIFTGHLPGATSATPGTAVVAAEPRRGRRWAASDRADRRRLPGRPELPGGAK
ncbi:hypothetical protein SAMN04488074_1365 [Lentzea albidocapillata subsp. violacea]|uniref:Uncharacterized protein n=2 Tax=Lentzea albidocapillata TaxID=40571 RepID=A0A1G9YVX1_9PSEU|nr:hypothetical protein SAMN04488074_1365 [Lentzea albidocapillata subsp. violacea]